MNKKKSRRSSSGRLARAIAANWNWVTKSDPSRLALSLAKFALREIGDEQPVGMSVFMVKGMFTLHFTWPKMLRMWAVRNGIHRLRDCAWRAHSFYPGRRKTAPIWTGLSTSP